MDSTQLSKLLKPKGLFKKFKDRQRELEKSGLRPKEAYKQASTEYLAKLNAPEPVLTLESVYAAAQNPPEEETSEPQSIGMFERDLFKQGNSMTVDDVRWVFSGMFLSDVTPQDAPSVGAWGYLMACRNDRSLMADFYRTV